MQKGFAAIQILILGTFLLLGSFLLLRNEPLKTTIPDNPSETSSPQPTKEVMEQKAEVTAAVIPPDSKNSCDDKKDVCFEADALNVTINEGYLEDADNWVSEQVLLSGKGSGGYQLKIEDFPKEFSLRSPVQNFSDGTKQKIYIRAQKGVTKKGKYSGKVLVRSYLSGNTTSSNLTINYEDWNDGLIHTYPLKVSFDCKISYSGTPDNNYLDCGSYDANYNLKFYYFGNHEKIEVRTIANKDDKRSLKLKIIDDTTTFDVNNVQTLSITPVGFPSYNKQLADEPNGEYGGEFVFIDQKTQKEIHRAPYTLKVTSTR